MACCKKCGNTMSFEVCFDEKGRKKWDTIKDQVGCGVWPYGTYAECKECNTRRNKNAFVKANV